MTSFKRNFSSSLAAVFLLVILAACTPKTQERPDGSENDAANFAVASMTGTIGGSKNIGEFPLPGEKLYNFKACLIDYSRRTNIPNGKFHIQEIDQAATTDAVGCVNWNETIKFSYLSDSIWLKMTRTFVGKGLQRGSRQVKFAINPWSHGESLADVLDLTKQTTPFLTESADEVQLRLSGKDKNGELKQRKVWVENGERNVTNGKLVGDSYQWHDQIFLRPQILFEKTDATPVLVPILHGSFKVEISLISEDVQNQKVTRMVWGKQTVEKVSIANNTLMIDADFALKSGPTSGQTMLGIKLIPLGAPEGLQAFEGIFPLGNNHSFTESSGLKISETVATENKKGEFTLQNFLGGQANALVQGIGGPAGTVNHTQMAGVYAGYLSAGDFKIVRETQSRKVLSYRASTCLANKIGNFGLTHRKFTLQTLGPQGQVLKTETVSTETMPCIYWEAHTAEFDRNECYHYIKASFRLQNADLGMDQTESLLINPWMEKAVDSRHAKDAGQYPLNCNDQSQRLKANNFIFPGSMILQRESYRPEVLDRSLQLTQRGVFTVQLNGPMKVDLSNESSGITPAPKALELGTYLLRMVFVREAKAKPDNGYVAHADVIMTSLPNGNLQGHMDIRFKDLQSTMARKMVVAQLFPVDAEKLKSKDWKSNDPDIEQIIDRNSKLASPIYSARTVVLGSPGNPIFFKAGTEDNDKLPDLIKNEIQKNKQNDHLIPDVVRIGEAAQNAIIQRNAFKENDAKAWADWSQEQNLEMVWLSDEKSVQKLAAQFGLQGDIKASLQALIDMKSLDQRWGQQFCKVLLEGPWKSLIPDGKMSDAQRRFKSACANIVEKDASAFIKKSSVIRILDMKPGMINPARLAVSNLTVSTGFGFTTGHTEIEGSQAQLGISAGAGANAGIANAGLSGGYSAVRMETDDKNRHSATDVGSSLSLGVTRWQFDIPVTSHQRCSLLRINPEVFLYSENVSMWSPSTWFSPSTWEIHRFNLRDVVDRSQLFKPHTKNNPFLKGWLICSDQKLTTPLTVSESYFLISQSNGDSESYDSLDEINRLFFFPIRGSSDMARFKGLLCDSRTYPKTGEMTDEMASDLAQQISPLVRRFDPAPGMILQDPNYEMPRLPKNETPWIPKSEGELLDSKRGS